jgi:hypothetical protein
MMRSKQSSVHDTNDQKAQDRSQEACFPSAQTSGPTNLLNTVSHIESIYVQFVYVFLFLSSDGVSFGVCLVAVINKMKPVAKQRTTMTWYFLIGPFWACIKEAVGQRITAG